ncbi:MAG: hypothetical protein V9F00_05595 [Nocardioides sp.]
MGEPAHGLGQPRDRRTPLDERTVVERCGIRPHPAGHDRVEPRPVGAAFDVDPRAVGLRGVAIGGFLGEERARDRQVGVGLLDMADHQGLHVEGRHLLGGVGHLENGDRLVAIGEQQGLVALTAQVACTGGAEPEMLAGQVGCLGER